MKLSLPRFVPTRRLAAVAAISAPIWLLSEGDAGAVAAAMVALSIVLAVLMDAILSASKGDIALERVLVETVGLGESVEGEYHLRARWLAIGPPGRWFSRIHLALHDAFPRGVKRDSPIAPRLTIPARTETVLRFTLTGTERGRFPLGPVAIRVDGPLGLVQRTIRYSLADSITVTPSIAGVRHYRLLSLQHRMRDMGVRTIRRRGDGTSFANLREYVSGDDPRHIEWKASARRQKLITREFTVEQGQTMIIAIDAGRMMTQMAGSLPRFEHALSAALVLADVAIHSGDHVGAIVFDDEVRAFVPPARGAPALRNIRDALVPLTATMAEPDYAAAFRMLASRHRKRSLIVMFTDVIDPRASQALIAHTSRSTLRHLPLVVALRNDTLMAAAVPAASASSSSLYQSAAAEELLLARGEAIARMRQAGVSVVDVSPHTMTAAIVNHYLAIKARSSL